MSKKKNKDKPLLLPCPYCGANEKRLKIYKPDDGYFKVVCTECGTHGPAGYYQLGVDFLHKWNNMPRVFSMPHVGIQEYAEQRKTKSIEQITMDTILRDPSSAKVIPANCDENGDTGGDVFKITDFCTKDSEGNLDAKANLSGVQFTLKEFLEKIYADVGDRVDHACPVCGGIVHKDTCWYPQLLIQLGKDLNEYDALYLRENYMKEEKSGSK